MRYRARLAALFVVLAADVLGSQGASPPAQQTPTFKVSVDYVEVDAVVTDGDGRFVPGLTQDDFQIFEDGRPQAISAFSLVDIPVEPVRSPAAEPIEPIEPDVRTNERPFDGRIYVMVIDDLHTSTGRTARVRAAARQFIEQHLTSRDLMAVVHTAGPRDASQEFTSSKRLLLAAVDRTLGRKLAPAAVTGGPSLSRATGPGAAEPGDVATDSAEAERQFNARRSLDTLKAVAEWFADVRGRRKAILFFSEGIEYDTSDFRQAGASELLDVARQALAAAARGNVSIYGVDPRGLTALSDSGAAVDDVPVGLDGRTLQSERLLSQASLRDLSEATGGFAVVNAGEFASAFARIVRDNSSYYTMAYYPPERAAGTYHTIEVRVRRPDLRVRARRGYVTPDPATPSVAAAGGDATGTRTLLTPEIQRALDSPLPLAGLGIQVFAAPFRGPAPNASVLVGIELRGGDLRLDASDRVVVTYAAVDAVGDLRGGSADSLAIPADAKARVAASGIRLLKRVDLPPGRYQLRVAARDSGGVGVGSVHYDLDVPDFAKLPLSASGLVLSSASALAVPTVRPDELLRQVLPGPPVAARTFPQNDEIAIFLEVYDTDARPHRVDITATVVSDDGREVFKTGDVRDSSELQGQSGGYGYAARLPMRDLPPGSYVLIVSAQSRLGDSPPVQRRVPFVVTAPRAVPSR